MRRETQNLLLVLLGGALLKISFTGTYTNYVKSGHLWLLITAGVVMLALAAVSIARDVVTARRTGTEPVAVDDPHGAHHHHHHPSGGSWLLLLPVLAVFLVAPPALGSDAVERASAGNSGRGSDEESALFPALPAGRVIPLPLGDFSSRASWDTTESLDDRLVRLTGFVVHDGSDVYVARLAIRCCAADAFPVKVRLHGSGVAALPDDSWVEVVVALRPGSATKANGHVPAVDVDSVRSIPQPADPYEN